MLDQIYITNELAVRPVARRNHRAENLALRQLAACMAERPAEVLPQFVDLAMRLTGGVSAGLSLYEPEPAPGIFRWRHLRGVLAPFEDSTTPRDFSPCGITLDRNGPTLARHPERLYDWIAVENIVLPEVLLVPLHIGYDDPLGTLWIVADQMGYFDRGHAGLAVELAGFAGIALKMVRSEDRLREALDEQEMLAREMSHRLKNLFAMTDGMIHGSARNAGTTGEMADALSGRLHALADAHSLVQRRVRGIGAEQRVADLAALVTAVVKVHDLGPDGISSRFSITGPGLECGDHATNSIALIIHELATNAAKYGALRASTGHVDIAWSLAGADIVLTWRERGGPPVATTPAADGFGTTLVRRTVERQFRGTVDYDWHPEGVAIAIRVSAAALAR